MNKTPEMKMMLESWIDSHSVSAAIELLAEICADKAEHIRGNGQDPYTAAPWDAIARKLECVDIKL
jgi:hypothetical protein